MSFEIDTQKTALIVFDMVNDFLAPGAPFESPRAREELVPRLAPLVEACRRNGVKVIYTGMAHRPGGADLGLLAELFPAMRDAFASGSAGTEVYGELAPAPGDVVVEKRRFDAFHGTELELILRGLGTETLIVVGTSASIGIETTARAAAVRDFHVIVPSDGTVNKDLPDLGFGPVPEERLLPVVLTMLAQFCRVSPIAELIEEIEAGPKGVRR